MNALVRDFTCAVCGAPRKTSDKALVVLCAHCGALLTHSGDGLWQPTELAERHAAGVQQLVMPSTAQARLMALMFEMQSCLSPDQRERWRLLAEEQILVMPIANPGAGMPLPADPAARARHLRDAVAVQEIATFDGKVLACMGAYSAATMDLTKGAAGPDPVATARRMLDAARAYYATILAHPDLPPGALREGADHHARELVRGGVAGMASLLGASVVERIRSEVLGDKTTAGGATCPKCGASLAPAATGMAQCAHCGAVTRFDTADAWTSAQLALWAVSSAELVRRNDLDGPAPVLAAVGGFIHTAARDVPPEKAVAFLERAIPWVTLQNLHFGLDLLAHGTQPDQLALLGAIRQRTMGWRSDPARRPQPAAPKTFAAPTAADEDAWIESALALYRFRGGPLIELLAQPLSAMQVAAVHEREAGVTPRAALTFFERAVPGFDRRAMLFELERMIPGYDHPRVRAFTTELARLLAG